MGYVLGRLVKLLLIAAILFVLPQTRTESIVVFVAGLMYFSIIDMLVGGIAPQLYGSTIHQLERWSILLPLLRRRLTAVDPNDEALKYSLPQFEEGVKMAHETTKLNSDKLNWELRVQGVAQIFEASLLFVKGVTLFMS